jgi:hypothetical protein
MTSVDQCIVKKLKSTCSISKAVITRIVTQWDKKGYQLKVRVRRSQQQVRMQSQASPESVAAEVGAE